MRYVMLSCCLFVAAVIGISVAVLFAEETKKESVIPSVGVPTEQVKQWLESEHRLPVVLVDSAMKYQIEIANPPVGAPTEQVKQWFESEHRSPSVLVDNAMKYQMEEETEDYIIEAEDCEAYFVILQSVAAGEQVLKYPYRGNEKVLDAIANTNGLMPNSSGGMWVARQVNNKTLILPVDRIAITRYGKQDTNYQLLPGDRVFIVEDGFKYATKAQVSVLTQTAQTQKETAKPSVGAPTEQSLPPFDTTDMFASSFLIFKEMPDKRLQIVARLFPDGLKPATEAQIAQIEASAQTAQPQKDWTKRDWSPKPKPKQIARYIYFEKEHYEKCSEKQDDIFALLRVHIEQHKLSVGGLPSKDGKGFYWILFGDEEIVSELHAVFSQITKGEH
ncbi:hypothetical protein FACS189454_00550 [Planctomycetales bacterium]|nr:hypothetical protein FACS189454_00550 [Planctomycetales bacterium]